LGRGGTPSVPVQTKSAQVSAALAAQTATAESVAADPVAAIPAVSAVSAVSAVAPVAPVAAALATSVAATLTTTATVDIRARHADGTMPVQVPPTLATRTGTTYPVAADPVAAVAAVSAVSAVSAVAPVAPVAAALATSVAATLTTTATVKVIGALRVRVLVPSGESIAAHNGKHDCRHDRARRQKLYTLVLQLGSAQQLGGARHRVAPSRNQ
jgi:hypothetical protein